LCAVYNGYLGLGSNIGDRAHNLQLAVDQLQGNGVRVKAVSSIYRTAPVGEILDQRDFYNACIQVSTESGPEQLLDRCKEIEIRMGRDADAVKHAPRPIDIDLLLIDGLTYSSERLTLPHPEVLNRRFVAVPLVELNAQLCLPDGSSVAAALKTLDAETEVVAKVSDQLKL